MTTVFYFGIGTLLLLTFAAMFDSAAQEFFAGAFAVITEYLTIAIVMAVCRSIILGRTATVEKGACMTLAVIAMIIIYMFACFINNTFGGYMFYATREAIVSNCVLVALIIPPFLLAISFCVWMVMHIAAL